MKWMRVLLLAAVGLAGPGFPAAAVPTTNGLYAAFNTTQGTFYCALDYTLTPRTVANFVSLAEGTKTWLDYPKAALVNQPFYNGLFFHRLITNVIIQAGSPSGTGDDDAGYSFNNEIAAGLNYTNSGVLAMANAGGTNSNGSQFFVTLSPQTQWNGLYTVFGRVVEGMNVVTNINHMATVPDFYNYPYPITYPLIPTYITNLTILRIGTAASNFNALAVSPPLPSPRFKASKIQVQPPHMLLGWTNAPNEEYRIFYSDTMGNWGYSKQGTNAYAYIETFWTNAPYYFFLTVESDVDRY